MADVRISSSVIPDDGETDGIFWRDGLRWLREGGRETPIAALSPKQEETFMRHMDSEMGRLGMRHEHQAREASRKEAMARRESITLELAGLLLRWQMSLDEVLEILASNISERATLLNPELGERGALTAASRALREAAEHYYSAKVYEKLRA